MLFALVFLVALVCVLMLLLWATPNVHSELEGKTWHFLVVRPGGRIACFLGKYLVAVSVSFATALVSLSGCVLVVESYGGLEDPLYTLICLTGVYGLVLYTGQFFRSLEPFLLNARWSLRRVS
jgi:ABC-type transport system involved in multi-copper enzyme maturation permease subunit